MLLPPFGPEGDLPEGLNHVSIAEFFVHFGSVTSQRVRLAARLQTVLDPVRPYAIVARVIVWGSFVSAKPDPADIDLLWVTLPTFERDRLPVQVGRHPVRLWDRCVIDSCRISLASDLARRALCHPRLSQAWMS